MRTKTSSKKGFTLIEIMIVVVIIGILAVALFPKLLGAISKSSDEGRKAELKSLSVIMLQYKNDTGAYPDAATCVTDTGGGLGSTLINDGYVNKGKFPKDPNKNNTVSGCAGYFYYVPLAKNGTSAATFALVAKMENKTQGNTDDLPGASDDVQAFTSKLKKGGTYYVELGL